MHMQIFSAVVGHVIRGSLGCRKVLSLAISTFLVILGDGDFEVIISFVIGIRFVGCGSRGSRCPRSDGHPLQTCGRIPSKGKATQTSYCRAEQSRLGANMGFGIVLLSMFIFQVVPQRVIWYAIWYCFSISALIETYFLSRCAWRYLTIKTSVWGCKVVACLR